MAAPPSTPRTARPGTGTWPGATGRAAPCRPTPAVSSSRVGSGAPAAAGAGRRPRAAGGGAAPGRAGRRAGGGRGRRADAAERQPGAGRAGRRGRRLRAVGAGVAQRRRGGPAASGWPDGRRRARSRRSMRSSRAAGEASSSGPAQPDQGDLEQDAGVGRLPHVDEGLAQDLHGPDRGRPAQAVRLGLHRVELLVGQADERPGHARPGSVWRRRSSTSVASWRGSWPAPQRSATAARARRRVAVAQRLDELADRRRVVVDPAGRRDLVEHRQGVADRALAPPGDQLDGLGRHVEAGVGGHPPEVLGQQVERQEAELEVLGAAADGGQHLLGLGGGQHEDDVAGRLLEGLEQGRRRVGGQHVDLVDDVDLPPARACRGRPATRARAWRRRPGWRRRRAPRTSSERPSVMPTQDSQAPQGSPSSGWRS